MAYKSEKFAGDKTLVALGAAIRDLRKAHSLSQEALAAESEIERSYLGAIERGEVNMTMMILAKICKVLNVKTSELLQTAGL